MASAEAPPEPEPLASPPTTFIRRRTALLGMAGAFLAGALIAYAAPKLFQPKPAAPAGEPALAYELIAYSDLAGWPGEAPREALETFVRSCAKITPRSPDAAMNPSENLGPAHDRVSLAGKVGDWSPLCADAAAILSEGGRDAQAQAFFERAFTPVRILNDRGQGKPDPEGLFTGYFETVYDGARAPTPEFSAAALARPADLVEANLGAFASDLNGRSIAGKVEGGRLIPFLDNAQISEGGLSDPEPLAWMRPIDLAFMQIQGSGRVTFPDGGSVRLGYAAKNGHPYTALGKVLVQQNEMALEHVTMQSIREWFETAPPSKAREVLHANASYVFFRILTDASDPTLGPFGAQSVQLTDRRSLAVDRRFHALGAPVWVDAGQDFEDGPRRVIRQLMIAQDTGGAIRGPVRGDVYWGSGPQAGEIAGVMKARGGMVVLLPRAVAARLAPEA